MSRAPGRMVVGLEEKEGMFHCIIGSRGAGVDLERCSASPGA